MRKQVRSKEQILYVWIHTSKTGNSSLPNQRLVSSVNNPTSFGIDPVSSLSSIKIIWEKIRENKLEAKNEYVLSQSIPVKQKKSLTKFKICKFSQ